MKILVGIFVLAGVLVACSPLNEPVTPGLRTKVQACSTEFVTAYKSVFEQASEMFEAEKSGDVGRQQEAAKKVGATCDSFEKSFSEVTCSATLKSGESKTLSAKDEALVSYCQNARAKIQN